jgi:tetratricopeptide (TPR) repeat protein
MENGDLADQVRTSVDEITLPTYRLLGENRNPVFHSQYGVAHIYPYTLQDEIANEPGEVTYQALVLENKYLRVVVLPQLGGRVFSVYDKISKREVFYKNPTIKFSPLAIRGAFFSGGLEFSFPVAHAPTTADAVNWDFMHGKDGSASIVLGGIEHISGMRWTITLSLFPGKCALAQDVSLSNPTPIPGRYHYWTNASLHSDESTEFIYPLQRIRSYEFAGTASWPVARLDSITSEPGLPGMEGVPMWPAEQLHNPINFRWEKDMLAQVSIFGRHVTWDYFGAWQHSTNTGYAHFARYQDVSGMKLWSWGKSEVGIVNQSALMDDGSLYAETQCGAMETQLDFDFLTPGSCRAWREWWLPLRQIGGLTCASAEIGARLHLSQNDDPKSVSLRIGLCPTLTIVPATITLSIPGLTLLQETARISPEVPWLKEIAVEAKTLSSHPITLVVENEQGQVLLNYTHDTNPYQEEFNDSQLTPSPESAEYYYQLGLQHENFDNRALALESYRHAILTSEEHGPSHLQLGLMLLRNADFDAATHHFHWAADLGIPSANYYLGLISWYAGDTDSAEKHYRFVPDSDPLALAALRGRTAIAFKKKDWQDAIHLINHHKSARNDQCYLQLLLGLAHRHAGNLEQAQNYFHEILGGDPLNLPALYELARLETRTEAPFAAKLNRLLADDEQYYLDLACFYLDFGLQQDASQVLEKAAAVWTYPSLFYLLANIPGLDSDPEPWKARARLEPPDYVFPSRLWEIIALQNAIIEDPGDNKTKYYLGNFYYAHQRYEEAILLWEAALPGLDDFDVIHRNLGWAHWQHTHNIDHAIQFFERALALNPHNQDLYLHLDDLYYQEGDDRKRKILLSKMEALDPIREDLRKRTLKIMVELGHYQEALDIMTGESFIPLEMDQSFHKIYVLALLQRAAKNLSADHIDLVVEDYLSALEFPENHGVGKPIMFDNAEIFYRLGCVYEKQGNYRQAINAWREAAQEHHKFGTDQFQYFQMSLDKLGRYSELGFEG